MAIQMTSQEYEKKYGSVPVVSAPVSSLDNEPAKPRMTSAEYELKFGAKPGQTAPLNSPFLGRLTSPPTNPFTFGNPIKTIADAGRGVEEAITGTGAFNGKGSIERGFAAAGAAAMAVPTVAADLIPGGKAALETVGKVFEGGINSAGNIGNVLADAAVKVGVMTPQQRILYEMDNAEFADSPVGLAIESGASVLRSASDVANTILMAHGVAASTKGFLDEDLPAYREKRRIAHEEYNQSREASFVSQTADEIYAVENKYVKGRKLNQYSKDEGQPSRERIAQSGVLRNSVDKDGLVRTQGKDGAVEQYKAMTIKPAEGVVRTLLAKEKRLVSLSDVEASLKDSVLASGLEGADLRAALNGVKREVSGLRLKADAEGNIPTTLLHDAKINTTNNINYQTPPETATYRKSVARGYKELVENNSAYDIKGTNKALASFYEDIARLENLDGARVAGGRLGKYTAQISGNIVGGAVGSVFGGPIGMAIGTILGGETAALVKGGNMSRSFGRVKNGTAPTSTVLDEAIEAAKSDSVPQSAIDAPAASSRTMPNVDTTTPAPKSGAWNGIKSSKQSEAGSTSTSNAPKGTEGGSGRTTSTSGDFEGAVRQRVDTVLRLAGNSLDEISIVGSTARGKAVPNDLDILITPKKLADLTPDNLRSRTDMNRLLENELKDLFPGKKIQITTGKYDPTYGPRISLEEFAKPSLPKELEPLASVNPTGSVFTEYSAKARAKAPLAGNMTTLDKTSGTSPDELITIYRGAPKSQTAINPGDFITTNKQLAKDYAGTGHVIEAKVKMRDVLDDLDEPLGEEYIYRPQDRVKSQSNK